MEQHANAALSFVARQRLVEAIAVVGLTSAAEAAGVSPRTARKYRDRFAAEGVAGLLDRSSRPHRSPNQTPPARVDAIRKLRAIRFSGPAIAELLSMPLSTVSAVLKREGMGRLGRLGLEPAQAFEVSEPGEVIHLDTKKLGRFKRPGHRASGAAGKLAAGYHAREQSLGWEAVHVAIDGFTRLAYAEVLPDETGASAAAFLERALAFYAGHGITAQRVHTDNGAAYRSAVFRVARTAAGLRHSRSRAYRPQTNGKAERFIRTMLDGWAYGQVFGSSNQRTKALPGWLSHYNYRRPHAALGGHPPGNNVPGPYS